MLAEYLPDLKLSGYELATQFQASSFRWNLTSGSVSIFSRLFQRRLSRTLFQSLTSGRSFTGKGQAQDQVESQWTRIPLGLWDPRTSIVLCLTSITVLLPEPEHLTQMEYPTMILMADRRLYRCWSFEGLVYLSWLTPGRWNCRRLGRCRIPSFE